jgi:predicted secreted hydrolase
LALWRLAQIGLLFAGTQPQRSLAQSDKGLSPRGALLSFPRDFGAHPETLIEWWYATGVLHSQQKLFGFQITFFRHRTQLAASPSQFSPQQILFAHAAVTDLPNRRLRHDQRIARQGFSRAQAATEDTQARIGNWHLTRSGPTEQSVYQSVVRSETAGFGLDITLTTTQPLLLQGQLGWSRKGPQPEQASHYYSQPQLRVAGALEIQGAKTPVHGTAWLDHEWSNSLLDPQAVGWDWIGMNLDDGSALTAFQLRRSDGSPLWAGGSFRTAGGQTGSFEPSEVLFKPRRLWRSPHSPGTYPVEWEVTTPAGSFTIRALLDDQELDSQQSTGAIYWEGLSECLSPEGRGVGRGYLEMTGYASALKI